MEVKGKNIGGKKGKKKSKQDKERKTKIERKEKSGTYAEDR